jgi:N utilization substance protein B
LYALDLNAQESVEDALVRYRGEFELDLDERSESFARELVSSTHGRRAEIDDVIQSASRNWRIERMSRVDRNILRLAVGELLASPEVPIKVVINEAVELAKRYGASEAPAFVNGILDRIAQVVRPGGDAKPTS